MKKSKILLPLALLGLVFGMAACNGGTNQGGGSGSQQSSQAAQEKITVTAAEGKTKLILGEKVQLTASVPGASWESKDPKVATVDDKGLVTSVAVGSTTITASKEGYKSGSITIKVELEKITITASGETSLLAGQTLQLSASQQGATWATSDKEVADVDQTGKVTAIKFGTVTITASKDGFDAGTIEINVVRPEVNAKFDLTVAADHYSADGWWELPSAGGFGFAMQAVAGWCPIAQNQSWGQQSEEPAETFVGGFGEGDEEVVKFTSTKANKAELVLDIGNSDAVDLVQIMGIQFNDDEIDLTGVQLPEHAGQWGNSLEFQELSLGEFDLVAGENELEIEFLAATNVFLNELHVYAGDAKIELVPPAVKEQIQVTEEKLTVIEGETVQIESEVKELTYAPVDETIVSVDEYGVVTGLKVGKTNVTVKKEGMYSVRVEVTVNPKPVAGQIIVEAEDGEEVTTDWQAGGYMKQTDGSGMGMGGDSSVVHSGGAYVTHFSMGGGDADLTLTIKFTAEKAQTMMLSVVGSAQGSWQGEGEPYSFKDSATESVNDVALEFTDQTFPAASGMNPEMVEVILGTVSVIQGENTLVFHTTGSAPSLDCFKLSVGV